MKLKYKFQFLLICLSVLSASCPRIPVAEPKPTPPPPQKEKGSIITLVTYKGKPLANAKVSYISPEGAQATLLTDSQGNCTFRSDNAVPDEGTFEVIYKNLVNKKYLLPIRRQFVEIAIDNEITEPRKEKLKNIEVDLEKAEKILNKIEHDLEQYLKQNPGSAMEEFKQVLEKKWKKVALLKDRVKGISKRYPGLLDGKADIELIDIKEHDRLIFDLIEAQDSLKSELIRTNQIYSSNQKAQPDDDWLQTDIFFASGQWRLSKLTPKQRNKLAEGLNSIKTLRNNAFPDYDVDELYLKINFVGYTDGAPVFAKDKTDLRPRCRQDGVGDSDDGNDCLSYLRARSIRDYFLEHLPNYEIKHECEGKGSILAPDQQDRSEYRKCVVSFILLPVKEVKD